MVFNYALFVIGGGSGGLVATKQVAGYGVRVAIAERDLVGGKLLNMNGFYIHISVNLPQQNVTWYD